MVKMVIYWLTASGEIVVKWQEGLLFNTNDHTIFATVLFANPCPI
jgi:hypothetical protein